MQVHACIYYCRNQLIDRWVRNIKRIDRLMENKKGRRWKLWGSIVMLIVAILLVIFIFQLSGSFGTKTTIIRFFPSHTKFSLNEHCYVCDFHGCALSFYCSYITF